MRHHKINAGDKLADKEKSARGISAEDGGRFAGRALDSESIAVEPAAIWHLSFRPEGDGPPPEIRIRCLLKRAKRSHGLQCVDFSASAGPAADGRPLPSRLRGGGAGGSGKTIVTAKALVTQRGKA